VNVRAVGAVIEVDTPARGAAVLLRGPTLT
jgi:hypothetical protein